eukprot:Amastigsp_a179417_38.p6 type:complete len:112 gc:universal Amastigsp_a179417_38:765-430(-)
MESSSTLSSVLRPCNAWLYLRRRSRFLCLFLCPAPCTRLLSKFPVRCASATRWSRFPGVCTSASRSSRRPAPSWSGRCALLKNRRHGCERLSLRLLLRYRSVWYANTSPAL